MRIFPIILSLTSLAALASGFGGCGSDGDTGPQGGAAGNGGGAGTGGAGTGGAGTGGAGGSGATGGASGAGGAGATGGAAGAGGSGGSGATGGSGGTAGAGATGGAAGTAGKGGASGSSGAAGSAGQGGSAGSSGSTPDGGGTSGAGGTSDAGDAGGKAGSAGTGGGSPEGGACVGDYVPGDYPPALDDTTAWLTISGLSNQPEPRQYKVHVPTGYDCHVPTPVLFCIHGLQQNGVMFCVNGTNGKSMPPTNPKGFVDKSNQAGFVLVIPNGYMSSWNGGSGHYGFAASMNLDDVGLMKAIFAEVKKHVNVDDKKVYATGLSNGAYMSYRLGCEAADVFTAVAPGAGGIVDKTGCSPSRPMSVLDIHGTSDSLVPFSEQLPSADAMATKNGCTTMTTAATIPASGGDTTCVTYSGCPNGIEVTRCAVQGGGHVWFGDPSCGTGAGALGCIAVGANSTFLNNTDVVWDFFKRLSR